MLSRRVTIAAALWLMARAANGQDLPGAAVPQRLPPVQRVAARTQLFPAPEPRSEPAAEAAGGDTPAADGAGGLTLSDLQAIARQRHPALFRASANVEAARGNQLQAGLPPNPFFAIGEQQLGSNGLAEQDYVAVSQEIVLGGKLRLNRDIASRDVNTAELVLAAQRQRVETDVRIAFYTALIAQQQRQVVEEILDVTRQGLKAAEDEFRGTKVGENDVLEARIEVRAAEIETQNSINRQMSAWRSLAAMVGDSNLHYQQLAGELALPPHERDWTAALSALENHSPEMSVAVTQLERAQLALRRASVEKVPNVTVDALFNVRDNGIGGKQDGGLQVSMPLPMWNRYQGAVAQATALVNSAQQEVERVRLDLQNRLAKVFERYSNAYYQVRIYRDEILPTAEKTLEMTRQNYLAGEALYDDLLTSQRTYTTSNLAYLNALLALWIAEAELDGLLLTGSLD